MPMFAVADAHSTGNTRPAATPRLSPASSSSCVSVPASKNFSISASSASATISISASRAACAGPSSSAGIALSEGLPLPSAANVHAFIATRSTTPRNAFSSPIGSCTGTTARPNTARSDSSDRSRLARSRSSRLRTTMRGTSSSSAAAQIFSVETSTPATASTTTSAASATRSAAPRIAQEIRHARRVDEVDLVLVPLDVGEAAGQRVLAGDFFFVVIRDRRPVVHAAEPVDGAGVEEQRRDRAASCRRRYGRRGRHF